MPPLFCKISSSLMSHLKKEIQQIQLFPFLSLAAALLPSNSKFSPHKKKPDLQIIGQMDQLASVNKVQACSACTFAEMNWVGHASEAATGIEFPKTLQNCLAGDSDSCLTTEILVGTGSRSTRVMRIKTLRIYAFGLYVHPASVCRKLGPKYASMPVSELNNQLNFFEDLLREDIDMTVRLVINFNGLKVNSVRDTFEKSLRNRLSKVNPQTDYQCLRTFTSYFTEDIPLSVGTTIDFRQTAKGQLITEIGGKQIGTVVSKDLCRAFFDMYIGDMSGSIHTKEEITRNVASIIRRC
ncbi:hypothetical protein Sjap_011881 [Stephania japonica]|uniref:Chalcone isomerase domain-containing protein n=1 Tax=Stephania japonica TaxID=461633 RepID=A0AAP0P5Y7_9MAGN